MKAQMLKIAGVKSEKEFYKKFPDEASFMKAHGKEFKKAMRANKVKQAQVGDEVDISFGGAGPSFGAGATNVITGQQLPSAGGRKLPSAKELNQQLAQGYPLNTGANINQMTKAVEPSAAATTMKSGAGKMSDLSPYLEAGQDVFRGITMIGPQKKAVKQAKQTAMLTGVQATAATSRPIEPINNQYVTPWDNPTQPNQMFPSYGVGTNVLAEDGAMIGGNPTEIMNTFDPNTIYTDMGYEPLSDSDRVKQFAGGGQLYGMLNDSKFGDIMNQGGDKVLGSLSTAITKEEDAGTAIGGGLGSGLGHLFFGPVGGKVGKFAGKLIGDLIDQSDRKIKASQKQTSKNMASIAGSQFGSGIQNTFSANVRDGGSVPKAQNGKGEKCETEKARQKEFKQMEKDAAKELKAYAADVAAEQRATARQNAEDIARYLDEGLTGYGDKIKKKEFEADYQAFAAQNPELAKDRLLYTLANKELLKTIRSKDYSMRNILGRIDPNLDYGKLTLPQLMQTMQKGFGSGQGYLDAWKEGFPAPRQRDGGQTSDYEWVSHTWQPQVITHFGEHKVSDLLRPPADADMLRTGGSIRQNYVSPDEEMMTQMALGGQIQTTWGGYAEPISQNPYMPSTGQTVMFRGQSHDESDGKGRTGIGVKYGKHDSYTDYAEYGTEADADVEVERNEPAVELPGADGENNMVVYGNLKIPNQFLHEIGDPKAKGKKFKTYVKDLSKKEQRQNKIIDSSSEKIDELNPQSPFDMLKFNSLAANIKGANMKLKQYAEFKQNAAAVQNAINDSAEELGLEADALAKGKVMQAKRGASVPQAQTGFKGPVMGQARIVGENKGVNSKFEVFDGTKWISEDEWARRYPAEKTTVYPNDGGKKLSKLEALPKVPKGQTKSGNFWGGVTQEQFEEMKARNPWYDWSNFNPSRKGDTKKFQIEFNRRAKEIGSNAHLNEDDAFGQQTVSAKGLYDGAESRGRMQIIDLGKAYKGIPELKPVVPTAPAQNILQPVTPPVKKDNSALIDSLLGQAMQYLRPSDVEELDPRQLAGELYALSTNQLEPVWAQKLQPRLKTPYDISLQDIMNENQANYNAIQRITGYNPAAQASLAAQKYAANQKVLGEQFRLNQAEKAKVYGENRDILNQYDLANMGILDKQYERQEKAKSITKATSQEALNSIASKIAQNKLENRTLATYENLYNYRFDPRFRAQSYQLAQFNTNPGGSGRTLAGGLAPGYEFTYDASGNIVGTRKSSKDDTGRNGAILKALKNL